MQMNQEELRNMITRIAELIMRESTEEQNPKVEKQKLYVMGCSQWTKRYVSFFETMESYSDWEVYAVIPESWNNEEILKELLNTKGCRGILLQNQQTFDCEKTVTVFPVVPRELVAKTALGISDTYETKWMESSMEQGGKIIFLKSGLKKFTGKEPKAYVERILSYYRTILEYEIEIK